MDKKRFIFIVLIACLFLIVGSFGIRYFLSSNLGFISKKPIAPSRISELLLNPKTTKQARALDVIEGHGIANAKVRVYLTPGGTTQELTTDVSGNWKFQIPEELIAGKYTLSVSVLDYKDNLISIKSYPFEIGTQGVKKSSFIIPNIVYAKESEAKAPPGYGSENWHKLQASLDDYGIHMEYENGEFMVYDAKKWLELCQYDCAKFKIGDHYGEPTPERLEALKQENIELIRALVDHLYLNGYRGISVIKNAVFPPIKDGKDPHINLEIASLLGLEEDVKFDDPNFIAAYNTLADQFAQKLAAKVSRSDFVPCSVNPGEQVISYEGKTYQLSNPAEPCTPQDQMSEEEFKQALLFVQQNSPLSTVKILEKQVDHLISAKNSKYMQSLMDVLLKQAYEPYFGFEPYFPGYIRNKPQLFCGGYDTGSFTINATNMYGVSLCDGNTPRVPTPAKMKEFMLETYNKRISQIEKSEAAKKYGFESPLWGFVLSKPVNAFLGTRGVFNIVFTDQEATVIDYLDAASGALFMLGPYKSIGREIAVGGTQALANVAVPALKATGNAGRRILVEAGGGVPLQVMAEELAMVSVQRARKIAGETAKKVLEQLAENPAETLGELPIRILDVSHEYDPSKGLPQAGITAFQVRPSIVGAAVVGASLGIIVTKAGVTYEESKELQEHGQLGIETHVSVEYKGQKPEEKGKHGFNLIPTAYAALADPADPDSEYVGLNITSVDTLPASEAKCSLSECEVKLPENPLPGDYVIRVYAVDTKTGEILAADSVDYNIPNPVNELLKVTLIGIDSNEQELYHKDKANLEDFNENGFRPINLYGLPDGLNAFRLVVYYTDGRTETFDPNKQPFTINVSHPEPIPVEEPVEAVPPEDGLDTIQPEGQIEEPNAVPDSNQEPGVTKPEEQPEEPVEAVPPESGSADANKPKIVSSKCGADNGNTVVLIDESGNEISDINCSDLDSVCKPPETEDGSSSQYAYCVAE